VKLDADAHEGDAGARRAGMGAVEATAPKCRGNSNPERGLAAWRSNRSLGVARDLIWAKVARI
jgi:hypothetical protein